MTETVGLSAWLSSLLKPSTPAPAPVAPPTPPVAVPEPALAAPASQAHPNLVALYDRARAREATLWQERLGLEPKLMAAFGMFGVLLAGAAIAMDKLVWGLLQWHSPWHVALIALPNVLAAGVAIGSAREARKATMELLGERRFPMSGQASLAEPLASLAHHPDALLTGLIQDLNASNNALELSVRKQQEKFVQLVRVIGRLGFVLVLQAGFNMVAQRVAVAAPAAPPPMPKNLVVSPAVLKAVPALTPAVTQTAAPAHPVVTVMHSLQPSLAPSLRPTASPLRFRSRRAARTLHPALAASPAATAHPATPVARPVASPVAVPAAAPAKAPAVPAKAPAAVAPTSHPAAAEPTATPYIHTP